MLLFSPGLSVKPGVGLDRRSPEAVLALTFALEDKGILPDRMIAALAREGAILPASEFYYAEGYHQQYLAKNPSGYCGLGGTGVSCPVGLVSAT